MGTSGFDPKTLDDNHELAETCILSITEHGPNAKVAVKSGGFMVEASAAVILAECWHRRIKLEKAAPQGNPGTGGGGRKPTRIERNPEGHRCAICDGTYAHVHGYDGNGEVPGMFDGSDWDGTAPNKGAGAGAPMEPGEHPLLGYYDRADQKEPTFNPGPDVPCVICYKPLCAPMKTISLLKPGASRSYFYRAHKACYEGLGEDEIGDLEWSMLNPPKGAAGPGRADHG
jgi:hypothetical protein